MTNFNERMNTLLYKNISLTLYSRKGWCWLCVRDELEMGTDCYILTQVLLTIAALLSHLVCGCSTVGHWEPKVLCLPLALTSASCPQLTPTVCALVILYSPTHLLSLFFRLFTQVHLLVDGSVKGQYVTYSWDNLKSVKRCMYHHTRAHTNNHIYHHTQQYANIIHTHTHTYTYTHTKSYTQF